MAAAHAGAFFRNRELLTDFSTASAIFRPRPDSGSPGYIGTTTSTSRWTARRPARSRCDGSSANPGLAFCETAGNPSSASSRSRTVAAEASAERDLSDFFGPPPFPMGTDRSAAAAVHPAVRASPTRVASCREAVTAVIIFSRFTIETEIADPIFSKSVASTDTDARPLATPPSAFSLTHTRS